MVFAMLISSFDSLRGQRRCGRGLQAIALLMLAGCGAPAAGPASPSPPSISIPKLSSFPSDLSGEELWHAVDFMRTRPPVGVDQPEARALRRQHFELVMALSQRIAESDVDAATKTKAEIARLEALGQLALANAPLVECDIPDVEKDREVFYTETDRVMAEMGSSPEAAAAAHLRVSVTGRLVREAGAQQPKWIERYADYACQQAAAKYPDGKAEAQRELAGAASLAETAGLPKVAARCFETWAKTWPEDPESPLVPATLTRLDQVGKPFSLKGPLYPKGEFDLASLKGKWVIVHLWRSAGNGADVLSRLERLLPELRAHGCEVVGICLDPDDKQLAQLVSTGRIRSIELYAAPDPSGDLSKHPLAGQFGIAPAPFTMLIDREGRVADNNLRPAKLLMWIDQLLRGQVK